MSQIKAKTIEIYLPTGDPNKVSHARITTEAIRIVFLQKSEIENQRKELERMGCYILVGKDKDGNNSVYIGETESLYTRLVQHKKEKDFWEAAYTIQNLGGTFDKAHLTFLEQLMIDKAKEVDRFVVHNGNGGKSTTIPESKMNECFIYFETIQTLIKSLGFSVFVPEIEKEELEEHPHFYFQNKEKLWNAEGVYVDEKFIVLKGSITRMNPTKHKQDSNEHKFRDKLIDEGIIKEQNGVLVFVRDYAFNSPSTAADIVSLGSNNGWTVWKTKDGKTLGEIYR
ncbi:MAG TPA: GIY-YIG nuclease family protein [Bacillota bacterium]|nr:GIY-YIG nuclease family protein [Bacillota bacterium]HPG43042.1 GIY-YIG nuclease family protein [Acholeplasmataceae bacterium]HPQ61724.1 GIY-YIG nuclease family protein [Bacillota bacterium]